MPLLEQVSLKELVTHLPKKEKTHLYKIFDEEVFSCFQKISKDKTAIMISHRLSATRFCDRILVLQDGHIAENGSHEQLMQVENGIYREMFETQAQYYKSI